jgi:hypothetical protein
VEWSNLSNELIDDLATGVVCMKMRTKKQRERKLEATTRIRPHTMNIMRASLNLLGVIKKERLQGCRDASPKLEPLGNSSGISSSSF